MPLSKDDYKARARALKKAGFIDYDLRAAEFTKAQKARIRRLYTTTVEILQHPEKFQKIRAGNKTRKAAKQSGIVTSKTALFVAKDEFTSVKIVHRKGVPIIKKISGEKSRTQKLIHGPALLDELEKMGKKKLPPNTWITVKIGKNSPFKSVYRSAADLLRYITTLFAPGDEDADIDELIDAMSLVTYHGEIPHDEKPEKRKRQRGMTWQQKRNFKGRGPK